MSEQTQPKSSSNDDTSFISNEDSSHVLDLKLEQEEIEWNQVSEQERAFQEVKLQEIQSIAIDSPHAKLLRKTLLHYYEKYAPENLGNIDAIVSRVVVG